jgi:hypothetical protein
VTVQELRDAPPAVGWRGAVRPIGLAALSLVPLAYVSQVDPNQAGHYPTCPFLWITGWYCPGCGSLRAVHALTHLDVGTALARNPLTVAFVGVLAAMWVAWLQRSVTGRARRVAPAWVLWTLLGVVCVFWVVRNLPGMQWLAP